MVVLVIAGLAAFGGALFSVLNRPVAADKSGNTALSAVLLALSAAAVLAGLAYAITGQLSD